MEPSRTATALRQIDSDAVLLVSNNIMALATALSKDAPNVENALQTVSTLATLLGGAQGVSAEATLASAKLLLNATQSVSSSSDSIAAADAASLLDNVLLCVSKVLGWLRPMNKALERTVMPQMLFPTDILGQTHRACSSAQCDTALVSTYSMTMDAKTLVDTPFPAAGPQGSMKVVFSSSTISLTADWMLDLHLTLWKFGTWGQTAGTAIVSNIRSLEVAQTTFPLGLTPPAAGAHHWDCMEWKPSELRWAADGCTALESRPGSITCACSTAGTFAVVVDMSKTVCGDGRVNGQEECDDDNVVAGDHHFSV